MPPLAEILRPKVLSEVARQQHLVGPYGVFKISIEKRSPRSFILWGTPVCGKTRIGYFQSVLRYFFAY
jgi:putative ATPase